MADIDTTLPRGASPETATATVAADAPARRKLRLPKLSGLGTWVALGWTVLIVLGALIVDVLPLGEARDPALALMTPSLLPPDLALSLIHI